MKKLLIFFLSIFLFTTVYGQEAIFKHVRSADSIRSLLENTKAGGAPVNIELKNTEGSASLRLGENGDFTIDGGNYVNIPMLQNSLVGSTYYLDGVDDYINLDLAATELVNVNNTKGAVVWRGRLHDFTTYGLVLWSFGDTDANEFMVLTLEGGNMLGGVCKVSGSDVFAWLAYNTFTEDIIYTIIFVQDGIEPKLYINGKLEPINIYGTVDKTSWFHQLTGVDNCRIGCNDYNTFGNAHFLNCDISLFQVWTRVPTLAEIEQMSLWGSDNSPIPYSDVGASNDIVSTYDTSATQDLSIILTANLNYSFIKGTADSLMIGLTKIVSDSTFLYTTGTVRANGGGAGDLTGSNLFHSGCIVNLNGGGMADDYWYDNSGNGLDGTNNGATLIRNHHTVFNTITIDNSGDIRSGSDSAVDAGTLHAYIASIVPSGVESGTADGEMLYWDTDKWKHTETSEFVFDDVNKFVGIGIANPLVALDINGSMRISSTGSFQIEHSNVNSFKIYQENDTWVIDGEYEDSDNTSLILGLGAEKLIKMGPEASAGAVHSVDIGVANTKMHLQGCVGIAMPNPETKLDIRGYSNPLEGESNVVARFRAGDAVGQSAGIILGVHTLGTVPYIADASGNGSSIGLTFRTNNTERIRITNTGNVGIGITNPLSKLSINGGLHVGGDSDAGDNNLLVDGTATMSGLIISGSTSMTSVSTGAADNDKMITQGHMDDAIEAATGAIVYSTSYSATNHTVLLAEEVIIFTDTGAAKDTCWLPDLYSGKGVWIRRGDNTNDVVITANDLTTDGSTNITNYNMTGTVNSVFCVQESTQWNIILIGN